MKVFNLCCELNHQFEGWFSSARDFDQQMEKHLVQCPMCDSKQIRRLPSAPRLNLSSPGEPAPLQPGHDTNIGQPVAAPTPGQVQALWMQMARHIQANTEDVGDRFAQEARAIHYNEAPERGIRGAATTEQAQELAEEGIDVMVFPMPASTKGPLQ